MFLIRPGKSEIVELIITELKLTAKLLMGRVIHISLTLVRQTQTLPITKNYRATD